MGQETTHAKTQVLRGDEPDVLLGNDSGPNAVELVLAALGFCYAVGFAYNAAALGYELEKLSYEVEGDLDLRNFVGIEDGPRAGFTAIRVHGRASAMNASQEQLDELCRYVQKTSPVGDIIANPVPIEVSPRPDETGMGRPRPQVAPRPHRGDVSGGEAGVEGVLGQQQDVGRALPVGPEFVAAEAEGDWERDASALHPRLFLRGLTPGKFNVAQGLDAQPSPVSTSRMRPAISGITKRSVYVTARRYAVPPRWDRASG